MTRTILLADDSVTIQKVVELTFLDEDYRVVAFGNGSDAVERLAEIRPDLVLADVHMPGADGYEVCAAVHQALPVVPVLLLVGTFEVFDAARAAEVGAAGHLKKPFDSQELLRRVSELVAASPATAPSWSAPSFEPEAEAAGATAWSPAGATSPQETEALPSMTVDSWSFEPIEEVAAEPEDAISPETWGGVEAPEDQAMASTSAISTERPAELEPAFAPEPPPAPGASSGDESESLPSINRFSEADVERIARRVVELLGEKVVRDVAWEVVPDLAEVLLKARIRELEASVE